jgi:predicted alpha-1,2-mannosidase
MSLTSHVDPFIGTDGPGGCLPGPYLPLSLVRLGPDVAPPHHTNAYDSERPIVRFSHTHVSGTGGMSRYGNIGVTPFVGVPRLQVDGYARRGEQAAAGYYAVSLDPAGIDVELTSTPRVGAHRYAFPAGASANLLFDLGAVVQPAFGGYQNDPNGWPPESIGGFVEVISDRELVGRADLRGGWGHGFPYSVFFYARSDVPAKQRMVANASGFVRGTAADGPGCRAVLAFGETTRIGLLVGISYASVAHARASVDREVGSDGFDAVRARADAAWERALSRIRVSGGTDTQRKLFYTLFARLLCMPSDLGIDDEFASWRSGVRHYSDYYCLWDSVRNANSFITLFDPELETAMLNCLLDIGDKVGWIPDAWIAGHSAMIQGGSSADILLCEAKEKGLVGIDYEKALRQMRKNNEVVSPDPYLYGRYLENYRDLGFVSTDVRKYSVSRHLEYAYQDHCIGRLAERLGHKELAERNYADSRKVWNLWREDLLCFGPKHRDGRWAEFNPEGGLADSWNDPFFYEGWSRQWSWNVQHDFPGLVRRHGGAEAFVRHLDEFFAKGDYHSKETMLHVPYLYLYAGRPDKTAEKVRWALKKFFKTERDGLSDNEDMGCQSTFYMASAIGLYPLMGQNLYWLTTPAFEKTEIDLGTSGRTLTIDAPGAGDAMPYVRSATLDGRPLDRAWLRHGEIAQGATLRFELSKEPTRWGAANTPGG